MAFVMPNILLPEFPDRTFDIRAFGAVDGGIKMNTEAINAAVTACHEAGGGTVLIPAGLWKTAAIVLRSNVRLHTEYGAFVQFSENWADYPLIHSHFEGMPTARCISPIYANDAENIAITGDGIFDGAGEYWRPCKKWKFTDRQWAALKNKPGAHFEEKGADSMIYPSEMSYLGHAYNRRHGGIVMDLEEAEAYRHFFRPVLVNLVSCRRILLEGVTFQNSAAWCLHPRMCDDLTMRRVTMRNPWFAQNGDALDLESCHRVDVGFCSFDAGDDGICIKSGKNQPGKDTERATKDVWIHDCVVYHGHGGFVIGSEMSCGVENMLVENCTFIGTDVGLRFKSCLGRGGLVRDIYIKNIRMNNIAEQAILFTMGYGSAIGSETDVEKEYPMDQVPEFTGLHFSDICCAGAMTGIELGGLKQMPIHDITFERVSITCEKGASMRFVRDIVLKDVTLADRNKPQCVFTFDEKTVGDGFSVAF